MAKAAECSEYDRHSIEYQVCICKSEFKDINIKLDRIDIALRGNGKRGLKAQVDRHGWILGILGAIFMLNVTAGIYAVWSMWVK